MSLGRFKEDPWQNSHPLYQESAFAMTPAPENANSEIILFSLYRVLGFAGLPESTVPQNGRDLDRDIQQFRNRKQPRKGAALDADSFYTMIHSALESPKLPSQSSKRFLQVTPLVPQAATFSGSARLTGSPWLPGAMVRRMVWLGAANAQAAEASWKALFDALSVSSTDDVFARFVQHEMAAWSPDLVWSPAALGEPPEPLDPTDWEGLIYPARQFVGDLQSIIDAKDSLTRRQWTSLLEAILRIGVVSHVLWLCEIHDRTWRCLRDTMAGAGPATPGQVREAVLPRRVTGFSYGDRAMATIKDRASAFLIARLGINAVLWALAGDQGAGSNLYTSQGLLSLCEAVRRAQPTLDRLAVPALVADLGERENRTIICRKGIGSNIMEFARYVLGQRQTANASLRGYDQGYVLKKLGPSPRSPLVVGLGPVAVLALVHCSLSKTSGPRSVRRLAQHLAGYGINVDHRDIAQSELGQQLRMLGLVLDSPDAESGMLLVPPFARVAA